MMRATDLGERTEFLGHSYKELEIPPSADGDFSIEANALHIWPRGRYMCIALPNDEQTFTVTLFLPNEGDPSFTTVKNGADARALFERDFADALPLIPNLERDFEQNPTGLLATLYLDRWRLDDRAVLLGDAAHAMVPFHGQGMNCAFEDCVALADHLERNADREAAFVAFQNERLPNARAIQQMALENYLEMRDRVDDDDYLLQRALERQLAERHPDRFVPRYAMVTFRRLPYAMAFARGQVQRDLLVDLTRGHTTLDAMEPVDAPRRAPVAVRGGCARARAFASLLASHMRRPRTSHARQLPVLRPGDLRRRSAHAAGSRSSRRSAPTRS